jgi:predicted dehydrogenase
MLKGALIGCGFFAYNHLYAWKQLAGAEIVALCDMDDGRLNAAAQKFGIDRRYRDARSMFESEQLDFVDIATTVESHRLLVEMAAGAKVACICQKPFARSASDAEAMVTVCAQAGVPLMVHENFRWQTPIQAIRRALDDGAIGTPFWGRFSFRSAFDVYRAQPYLAEGKRFIIEDLGIHILDVARFIMGDVATVSATIQRINPKIGGEDVATILVAHENKWTSVVDCSYASARAEEVFPQTLVEIDGEHGSLRLDAGYKLTTYGRQTGTKVVDCTPPLHDWAEKPWFNIQDSVVNIQKHWLECLQERKEPQTSGHDNLKTLALVEAAYESARTRKTIRLA